MRSIMAQGAPGATLRILVGISFVTLVACPSLVRVKRKP